MDCNPCHYKISIWILFACIFVLFGVLGSTSGYTGKEITVTLNRVNLTPISETGNLQIKVIVNYSVSDPTLIGQKINAVLKVHSSDGNVLKTTSFPVGFAVNKTGTTQFLTSIPRPNGQNITTEATFMNLNKTSSLSNTVTSIPMLSPEIKSSEFTPTM